MAEPLTLYGKFCVVLIIKMFTLFLLKKKFLNKILKNKTHYILFLFFKLFKEGVNFFGSSPSKTLYSAYGNSSLFFMNSKSKPIS